MDDITFCLSECKQTDCFRHPSNIQDRTIPHSYADFTETETCPEFAKDINAPINDDTISRKSVIDALDALCDRECEYSKQQRSVMCGACRLGSAFDVIDELPSAQPEIMHCKDCRHNHNCDIQYHAQAGAERRTE